MSNKQRLRKQTTTAKVPAQRRRRVRTIAQKSRRNRRAHTFLTYLSFFISAWCAYYSLTAWAEGRVNEALIGWMFASALYLTAWAEGRK